MDSNLHGQEELSLFLTFISTAMRKSERSLTGHDKMTMVE
jgi:hypothetical protein